LSNFVRVRHPQGKELTIDLIELEDALQGGPPGDFFLLPDSGRIVFVPSEDFDGDDEQIQILDGEESVAIDPIEDRDQFRWMEDFVESVHSISAQNALRDALGRKKPFRNFKDAMVEYPSLREKWAQFEAEKIRMEAIRLLENLDFEILEIAAPEPQEKIQENIDPAETLPLTAEEYDYILQGAWQIAAKGGRSQLALLLKGSRNETILKHQLDQSPVYGKLSHLTIEEIENRVDQLIRKGELRTEFFGNLPFILLSNESWVRVQPWAHHYECQLAVSANTRRLTDILINWRSRRREEQYQLLDAILLFERDSARRVLHAWRELSGKEMRSRIQATLSKLA
jgi:hypothetical protein